MSTRLLTEPASAREIVGDSERRTGVYTPVHEDSSTESTCNLSAGVGLGKKSTVLITGSRSFTGSYLRKALLSRGYTVWGMTNECSSDWEVSADLTKSVSLRQMIAKIQPHYVIHLAGISNLMHNNIDAFYQINLHGTLNLLSAIQEESTSIKKIILASSAYIYGNASHVDFSKSLITEQTAPNPINHYAMSKLSMEYMSMNLYPDLPIVITRPFNYTGVGQQDYMLIPKIIHHFANKLPEIHLGNLHVYREFNDVRMVAQVYSELLTKAEPGTLVNVCTGKNYCLHDILKLVEKISKHSCAIHIDPAFVRKNDPTVISGNPEKLRSIISDLPSYTIEETLRWMFES